MRLAGEKPGPGLAAPRLVGRDRELGQVRRWLAAAATGRGGVLVLQGDAGLGKTRLVQEIAGAAQARGIVMRAAEASELEQTRPFGVISDALGISPRSADPALAGLARRIEGQPAWSGPLEDVPVEVHNLVEALTGVFESLCTTAEVLLVIDNLHWADSSSLAVLRRLIRLGRQYPALIVATTRPTDQPPVMALVDAARQGGGAVLDLSPLDPESALALAGQLAGGPPGPRLAARVAQAAGNPLFVVELLTTLIQHGQLRVAETGQAEAASSVRPGRAGRQHPAPAEPAPSRVDRAAPGGRHLRPHRQPRRTLHAHPPGHPRPGRVAAGRETGRDRRDQRGQAVVPPRADPRRAVSGLAVAGPPLAAPRARGPAGSQRRPRLEGRPPPVPRRPARRHGRGAVAAPGGLAAAPRDPAAAVSLLGRAAELAAAQASTRDVIRTDLSVALGWAGHTDDAERLAAAVMTETLDVGVRARAASWLTSSLLLRGRPQQARDLCRRALASGVGSARVEILLRMVAEIASVALGDRPGALDRMRQLLAAATELGDTAVRSVCLQGLSLAEANAGDLDAAAAHGAAAVRDTESVHTAEAFMANTHVLCAWILEEQDRLAEALDTVGRLATLAAANAESPVAAQIDRCRARAHFAAGHWDEAVVDLDSALRVYDDGQDVWPESLALRALIAVHRGQM